MNDVEGDEEDAEETPDEDAGSKKRKVRLTWTRHPGILSWLVCFQRPASKSKAAKPAAKKAKASGSRVKKSKAMVDDEDDED